MSCPAVPCLNPGTLAQHGMAKALGCAAAQGPWPSTVHLWFVSGWPGPVNAVNVLCWPTAQVFLVPGRPGPIYNPSVLHLDSRKTEAMRIFKSENWEAQQKQPSFFVCFTSHSSLSVKPSSKKEEPLPSFRFSKPFSVGEKKITEVWRRRVVSDMFSSVVVFLHAT